jgi:hypothetical protein
MTLKRLSLTLFFILLTLSIGLVSVNLPLPVKAQNTDLYQSGNGDSEQQTEQSQSYEQDGQVISGYSSILSGNNRLCENQDNSEQVQELTGICNLEETNLPPTSPPPDVNFLIDISNADCVRLDASHNSSVLRCHGDIKTTLFPPLDSAYFMSCLETNVIIFDCTLLTDSVEPTVLARRIPPQDDILDCRTT